MPDAVTIEKIDFHGERDGEVDDGHDEGVRKWRCNGPAKRAGDNISMYASEMDCMVFLGSSSSLEI